TRAVAALEEHIGVPLLHRTTRKVLATEAGETYFNRVKRLLSELDEAQLEASGLGNEPKGVLRISCPIGLGQLRISYLLPKFLKAFPQIQIQIQFSDDYVDLLAESIDVALRVGIEKESSLRARKLEEYRRVMFASPAYLKERGVPKSPEDLKKHACLTFNYGPGSKIWYFKTATGFREVAVDGPIHGNSIETIIRAARAGLGVGLSPSWAVAKDLAQGTLVPVLAQGRVNLTPVFDEALYAVYVGRRPAPKIRAWIDFLLKEFTHSERNQ
ncbi:MAG: LysR substrate-binding domain-containing protein, partial [Bdellovibrionota bacterium]